MSRIGPMLIRGFRAAKQWKSSVHPECATSPSQINSIRSPYQKTEERMEVLISIIICSLSQVNPFPLHLLSRSMPRALFLNVPPKNGIIIIL